MVVEKWLESGRSVPAVVRLKGVRASKQKRAHASRQGKEEKMKVVRSYFQEARLCEENANPTAYNPVRISDSFMPTHSKVTSAEVVTLRNANDRESPK